MCNFASAVLTETDAYWLSNSDRHEEIIAHYKLKENRFGGGVNILRVELTPDKSMKNWPSLELWKYKVDQDILPSWYDVERKEKRSRCALKKRLNGNTKIDARGCTALTALDAPKAGTVDASGCTELKKKITKQNPKGGQ